MQVALLALVVAGQYSTSKVVRVGECVIRQTAGDSTSPGLVTVSIGKRVSWKGRAGEPITIRQIPVAERFCLVASGAWVSIFTMEGSLVREVSLPAVRDPRPILFSNRWIIFGCNVYNWTAFDVKTMRWQQATRKFVSIELKSGKKTLLPSFTLIGLPLNLSGSLLLSIVPRNWRTSVRTGSSTSFWITRTDLLTGKSLRRPLTVRATDGKKLVSAIIGDEMLKVNYDTKHNHVTILDGTKSDVSISLPKRW